MPAVATPRPSQRSEARKVTSRRMRAAAVSSAARAGAAAGTSSPARNRSRHPTSPCRAGRMITSQAEEKQEQPEYCTSRGHALRSEEWAAELRYADSVARTHADKKKKG